MDKDDHELIYNISGDGAKESISAGELRNFSEWVATAVLAGLFTVYAFIPDEFIEEPPSLL